MATYAELYGFKYNDALLNKIEVSVWKKAQLLLDGGTPTAAQLEWAKRAIASPRAVAEELITYALAANSGLTVAQISSAADAGIQSQISAAADALIAGGLV